MKASPGGSTSTIYRLEITRKHYVTATTSRKLPIEERGERAEKPSTTGSLADWRDVMSPFWTLNEQQWDQEPPFTPLGIPCTHLRWVQLCTGGIAVLWKRSKLDASMELCVDGDSTGVISDTLPEGSDTGIQAHLQHFAPCVLNQVKPIWA